MKLKEALIAKGNTPDEAQTIIAGMVTEFLAGGNPEEILDDEGLELDYMQDLLYACEDMKDV